MNYHRTDIKDTLDLYTSFGMWCEYTVYVEVSCVFMRASPWICKHHLGCGVNTLCMCVCVMCMYACITLDLYTLGCGVSTLCVCVSCACMRASLFEVCVFVCACVYVCDRYVRVHFQYWDLQLHVCMCEHPYICLYA